MKKMNKKGFTIVELVIVIAVIAILSAVMIPTFSGIVQKANDSALEQKIAAAYKEAMANELADDGLYNNSALTADKTVNGITFTFIGTDGDADAQWTEGTGDAAVTKNAYITKGEVKMGTRP